jgi:hypothetical protein
MESIKRKVMSLKLLHLSVIDLQCKSTLFLTDIALNFTSMTDKLLRLSQLSVDCSRRVQFSTSPLLFQACNSFCGIFRSYLCNQIVAKYSVSTNRVTLFETNESLDYLYIKVFHI